MQQPGDAWFLVDDIKSIDSPALLIYRDRVQKNIMLATELAGDAARLRPHVKTSKIAEVNRMLMDAGITKFKCATIAEAEMLGQVFARDVLMAYQPAGPRIGRFTELITRYPQTRFSCLIDNRETVEQLSEAVVAKKISADIFLDINTGMNRSGIAAGNEAFDLYAYARSLGGLRVRGLHAYDGHIRVSDPTLRQQQSDQAFEPVARLSERITAQFGIKPEIVVGGTPTFLTHAARRDVECSPGTFVFWDRSYQAGIPEQPFVYAALLITRVVSIPDAYTICTDLGHKSVAAENPQPRVFFLNAPELPVRGQSEEHLVLQVEDSTAYRIGDVLYGVPYHICPTVALYERAVVIEEGKMTGEWKVIARDRKIHI